MRNNVKFQVATILVLIAGVVGLTIGFSNFSNSLSITGSASVSPNSNSFAVRFSNVSGSIATEGGINASSKNPNTLTAGLATIDNSGSPTISGLSASFTEPGQSVTYTFYAGNIGAYVAYLNSISYVNINGEDSFKTCSANAGTNQDLVDLACNDIILKIKVGSEEETSTSVSTISGHSLDKSSYEQITATLEYVAGGHVADGDFSVTFGNITLEYNSVD